MKAAGPAFVVMTDDAEANVGPFFNVRRRVNESFNGGVLDAFAKAIDGFGAGLANGGDVFIGEAEVVAGGKGWVGAGIWENDVVIDDVGVWPAAVMEAGEGNAQFFLGGGEVDEAAGSERAFVDAVERSNDAVCFGKVDGELEFRVLRAGGGKQEQQQQE